MLAREAVNETFELVGLRASYQPPGGGAGTPCKLARDLRDLDADAADGRPLTGQQVLEVRAMEIAAPATGGTFTLSAEDGGRVYQIVNRPQHADPYGLVWSMWVS